MILLSGHSMTQSKRVPVEALSLNLKERDSTATMTPADMSGITTESWFLDDENPGAGIVWRVRSIEQAYAINTPTIQLEHIINTLKDRILFGEVTPEDIGGGSTCTAEQAVRYILDRQSDWVLGDFSFGSVSNPYRFDGESLFDALVKVTRSLDGAWWSYDMTSYPFTLNITEQPEDVPCEMRPGRNLNAVTKTVDKGTMYTRFYPIGKDDLHVSGEFVSRNEDLYGVISHVEVDQSRETEAELIAWAEERLRKHAEPYVNVTAEGVELAEATGESLDRLILGRICRIPLEEFWTTIEERIVELNYPDKVHEPENVTVILSNQQEDVAQNIMQVLAETIKTGWGGSGGRGAARQAGEDHAWFEDTDEHVAMVAEGIIGVDPETGEPNWVRLSEFIADGEGLHAKVETQIEGVTDKIATLEINEEQIRSEVSASESTIYSTIQQTASNIRSEVANVEDNLHSVIEQTASNIHLEVSRKNSVYSQWGNPSTTQDVSEGDIWVKTNGIRTYGKAGEYTWDTLGGYAWADFYGSEIYVLDEDGNWVLAGGDQLQNISRTLIDQTDERIALITDSMSGDYSEFIVELGRIHSRVTSVEDGLSSTIEQTASMIRTAVWTANSEMYSEILQTQSMIRSEVANTESNIRSTITQTASGIWTEVGRKSTVFTQWGSPSGTKKDGDIWIKDNNIRTWLGMETKTWNALSEYKWSDFYGSIHYVWENGAWKEMASQQLENINHSLQEVTDERISNIVEDMAGNYSEFIQEKSQIRSTVRNLSEDLGSSIRQTASEIRSDVWAAKSSLYSSITQTASSIRMEVANTESGLRSSITQTATSIRSEVSSAKSSIYSAITQNANRIALVVEPTSSGDRIKAASIVASINNGASSVVISANHINLDGYVKATDITADFIATKIASIANVNVQSLTSARGGISVNSVGTTNFTQGGVSCYVPNGIWSLRITQSGNTYTLQRQRFSDDGWVDVGTFSRATTLSGAWSGGKLTVSASPQGESFDADLFTTGHWGYASNETWTTYYGSVSAKHNGGGTSYSTGEDYTISALDIFEKATVTLQGQSESVYVGDSEGTAYYQSGGSASGRNQGEAGPMLALYDSNIRLYYQNSSGGYSPAASGAHAWYYSSTNGTQYYRQGSTYAYSLRTGDPIRLSTATRYKAGSKDTSTYYKKKEES